MMRKVAAVILFSLSSCFAYAQQAQNISFLSLFDDKNFTVADPEAKYSSCWGWFDDKGAECAIFGSRDYTYFLDIANPAKPELVALERGRARDVVWREYRTYKNYVYAVNDGADGSLQIFDMSKFPQSVQKVYDSDTLFARAHTLFIDNGRLYVHGARKLGDLSFTLGIFDIATNPAKPTPLAYYDNAEAPYVHDAFAHNDTIYAFSGYEGLHIYDAKDPKNITLINSLTSYPASGYCHSGTLDKSGKYLFVADEIPVDLPLKTFDVADLNNINFVDTFRSNTGFTPHNTFVRDDLLFVSYYEEGVQVWNVADPANPVRVAWYDTYPDTTNPIARYHGCWNVYPYFPSRTIIAIDRKYGLYVLNATSVIPVGTSTEQAQELAYIYPNPVGNEVTIDLPRTISGQVTVQVFDAMSRLLKSEIIETNTPQASFRLKELSRLSPGMYAVHISTASQRFVAKVIKQ